MNFKLKDKFIKNNLIFNKKYFIILKNQKKIDKSNII